MKWGSLWAPQHLSRMRLCQTILKCLSSYMWLLLWMTLGLKEDKWKWSFLGWSAGWDRRAGTRDFCSALAALGGPVQNIFFFNVHNFILFSPSPSKLGRQPCWVACFASHWLRKQTRNIVACVKQYDGLARGFFSTCILYRCTMGLSYSRSSPIWKYASFSQIF